MLITVSLICDWEIWVSMCINNCEFCCIKNVTRIMLGLVSTVTQPLWFSNLTSTLTHFLVWYPLCACVNPVGAWAVITTWSQQLGCCENEYINRTWGAHISFLWASQIHICPTQTHGFEPLKISLAFLRYYCIGNCFCFVSQLFANSLHLFYRFPFSMKRSTPISDSPFMIISISTARQILYFSLPIHWSTNLF